MHAWDSRIWRLAQPVALVTLLAAAGCGGDDSSPTCGDSVCTADEQCCVDCAGRSSCVDRGLSCPAACPRDGGGDTDGGVTGACGTMSCGAEQACCITCSEPNGTPTYGCLANSADCPALSWGCADG